MFNIAYSVLVHQAKVGENVPDYKVSWLALVSLWQAYAVATAVTYTSR